MTRGTIIGGHLNHSQWWVLRTAAAAAYLMRWVWYWNQQPFWLITNYQFRTTSCVWVRLDRQVSRYHTLTTESQTGKFRTLPESNLVISSDCSLKILKWPLFSLFAMTFKFTSTALCHCAPKEELVTPVDDGVSGPTLISLCVLKIFRGGDSIRKMRWWRHRRGQIAADQGP